MLHKKPLGVPNASTSHDMSLKLIVISHIMVGYNTHLVQCLGCGVLL